MPLRGTSGKLLGVVSVDEPENGRRPSDADLDALVASSRHAALAIRIAQDVASAAQHQRMLEHVLEVSARLAQAGDVPALLQSVCDGIRDALAFDKVVIELADEPRGTLVPVAAAGWMVDAPAVNPGMSLDSFAPLFTPEFEVAGCYLVPHDAAEIRLGPKSVEYQSELNGRGPHAWNRHWLLVPLSEPDGRRIGLIWVDDPRDRLLPSRTRMQALRLFANQAMSALHSADQVVRLRYEATHDPLTSLPNRRALLARLPQEVEASKRSARHVLARALRHGQPEDAERHARPRGGGRGPEAPGGRAAQRAAPRRRRLPARRRRVRGGAARAPRGWTPNGSRAGCARPPPPAPRSR